jgi:hypothetical protein
VGGVGREGLGVGGVGEAELGGELLLLLHPTVKVERPGAWGLGVVGCGMVIKETDLMEMLFGSGEGFGEGSVSAQIHGLLKLLPQPNKCKMESINNP